MKPEVSEPRPKARKALIQRHKTLARILLYGIPLALAVGGYLFIKYADPRTLLALDWTDVDYEKLESVQLFREYLQHDTTFPDGNEIEAAEFLARVLEAEGIEVELERLGDRYANLRAVIEGRDPRRLVLHSHIDTEPVRYRKRWRVDPFGGVIELPFIYGRGAFDMKSIAIAQLMAMLEIQRSGETPARSVELLATSDEERDSWLGTRRLLRQHPEWSSEIWAVLTEGGAVEATDLESVKYWGTEYHQKRFVDIWVCDSNRKRLRHLRRELHNRETSWRLEPAIAEFMPYYGPSRDRRATRRLLAKPDLLLDRLRSHPVDVGPTVLTPYIDAMMRSLVAAFPVEEDPEGGYQMRIILHLLPSLEVEDVWPELIGDALDGFTYRVEEVHPPVAASDLDHPAFQTLHRFMEERLPNADHGPLFIPYTATDARYFRQYGIPTYGFSPFHILSGDAIKMRGADERMPLPAFVEGVELYTDLVRRLVEPPV